MKQRLMLIFFPEEVSSLPWSKWCSCLTQHRTQETFLIRNALQNQIESLSSTRLNRQTSNHLLSQVVAGLHSSASEVTASLQRASAAVNEILASSLTFGDEPPSLFQAAPPSVAAAAALIDEAAAFTRKSADDVVFAL